MIKRSLVVGVVAFGLLGCPAGEPAKDTDGGGSGKAKPSEADPFATGMQSWAKTNLGALPDSAESATNPLSQEKVDLGRMLYFETRMSAGNSVSCNTCHDLTAFGIDSRDDNAVSMGHEDQKGTRNSPTVYNAAFHTSQFWDGREPDVESQAIQPLINAVEHAMADHNAVVDTLKGITGYAPLFKAAFPESDDPITIENVGKAIGAFERLLVTPSPFDAFVKGDLSALSEEQLQGIKVYKEASCITCHAGPSMGGNMKQKLGLKSPYKVDGKVHPDNGTEFKVPGLRNIAKTGPYLHDGSQADLLKVVMAMAEHQAAKPISEDDAKKLVAFLESLTGKIDSDYIKKPELPQ